ncbi:uncharacterized protein LOC130906246 [Corythoichthys intestinalis]|uniref:uncharacterized protein LOC130906246 n=1 Tax=Corythoichthys intestinalis TaxID=161448 RepID=UPI0025A60B76|nr:uncharacterized protein LOC130906246 [Corythoichthys intestinalis]XP_057676336.1 uncharacterized protein LOC130906246 [Corythoichthys intestinalis]
MRNFTPRMMMHSFSWLFGLSLLFITFADDCPVPVSTEIVTNGAYGAESSTSVTTSGECVSIPGNRQVTFEFDACRYYPCGWASKSHYYLSSVSWSYYTTVAYSGNDWQISCQSHPHPVECGKMADSISLVRVGALGAGNARLALTVDLRTFNLSSLITTTTSMQGRFIPTVPNCLNLLLTPYASSADSMPFRICQSFPQNLAPHRVGQAIPGQRPNVRARFTNYLSKADALEVATGVINLNANSWLERASAAQLAFPHSDCLVCMVARPLMLLVTPPIDSIHNMSCILPLMSRDVPPTDCIQWDSIHPLSPADAPVPMFHASSVSLNSTCFHKDSTRQGERNVNVGGLPSSLCRTIVTLNETDGSESLTKARADVWWFCGGTRLFNVLAPKWSGTCALVSAIYPALVAPLATHSEIHSLTTSNILSRHKRALLDTTHPFFGSQVYIDAIGVLRGVPDAYKSVDQAATGFENLPISAILPVSPNKNVDRINYLHYNQQRLANYTRGGFEAVYEQLAATSPLTLQSNLAVDMLLAKEDGICSMFGDQCCTVIPNNAAPDGSLTASLKKLQSLSNTMKSHSGVDTSNSIVIVAVFAPILAMCVCCCIPCVRSRCKKIVITAIEKHNCVKPPPYVAAEPLAPTTAPQPPPYVTAELLAPTTAPQPPPPYVTAELLAPKTAPQPPPYVTAELLAPRTAPPYPTDDPAGTFL